MPRSLTPSSSVTSPRDSARSPRPSTIPMKASVGGLVGWLEEEPKRIRDLATIVDMLPDVLFKCEKRADGKIYWLLNEGKLAEEFGLTTDKVKDKSLDQIFPPHVVPVLLEHFERCFAGEAHEFVNELYGRYFYHYPQPVFDDAGRVRAVVGFISEVTTLKAAEQEILRLNHELEARVRELETANRQLEAYSYSVSHDLRGPLAVMRATLYMLNRSLADSDPEVRAKLERLDRSTRRMDSLIDDILALAKATRGELRRVDVDLSELAEEVVLELRLRDPNRDVHVSIAHGLRAKGDPRLLRVVLDNLFSNAWKYTGQAPKPRIELRAVPGQAPPAFVVEDNGAGFDSSQSEKLFTAFERFHQEHEFDGNGVGLATVRRILVAHGGDIWAQSVPGHGASFFFSVGVHQ